MHPAGPADTITCLVNPDFNLMYKQIFSANTLTQKHFSASNSQILAKPTSEISLEHQKLAHDMCQKIIMLVERTGTTLNGIHNPF